MWESINNRLESLPILICGPIVRRVESNYVSIWVTLNTQNITVSDVQLTLYTKSTNPEAADPLEFITEGYANSANGGLSHLIKIGKYISVALVTVEHSSLTPGKIHYYNLTIIPADDNYSETLDLNNEQVVDKSKICFEGENLPSFVVPPEDISALRVLHTSCRKPHGEGEDALAGMSQVIGDNIDSTSLRPQLLFLTGDQIYADDVADALLFMIDDAREHLFGYDEALRDTTAYNKLLTPGFRSLLVSLIGKLLIYEPKTGKSHLMKFSEYALMYLFCWSDELWPSSKTEMPTYDQVIPRERELEYLLVDPSSLSWKLEDIKASIFGAPEVRTRRRESFNTEVEKLKNFFDGLKDVRKVLANISTYTIFDDHDITDDWYMNASWSERVLNCALSRNMILNGLSAYFLFQGWGNMRSVFDPYDITYRALEELGENIFDLLEEPTANRLEENRITSIPVATFDDHLYRLNYSDVERVKWHYSVEFDSYSVAALDTRTMRSFPEQTIGRLFPELIAPESLGDQLFNTVSSTKTVILISPSPIIGVNGFENYLYTPLVNTEQTVTKGLAKLVQFLLSRHIKKQLKAGMEDLEEELVDGMLDLAEEVGGELLEKVSQFLEDHPLEQLEEYTAKRLKKVLGDRAREQLDAEAWGLNKRGIQKLYRELSAHFPDGRFIVLSGDVHYGYTARHQFWSKSEREAENSIVVAQCTAGSAKNQGNLGKTMDEFGVPLFSAVNFGEMQTIGWQLKEELQLEKIAIGTNSATPNQDWEIEVASFKEALFNHNDYYWENTILTGEAIFKSVAALVTENPAIWAVALLNIKEAFKGLSRNLETTTYPPANQYETSWQYRTDLLNKSFFGGDVNLPPVFKDWVGPHRSNYSPDGLGHSALIAGLAVLSNTPILLTDAVATYSANFQGICGNTNFGLLDFHDYNQPRKSVYHQIYFYFIGNEQNALKAWKSHIYNIEMAGNLDSYPKLP